MPEAKPPADEDELDELPPIDGGGVGEDDPTDGGSGPEDLDDEPDDGGDPLDDSTGEGDPLEEIEVSGSESGWLEDAGDSETLDVGAPDTLGAEEESATLLEGAEELDVGEDELAFGDGDGGTVVGDAGEEGFEDEEEDLREEDLPRLDADEEGAEQDDADLLEHLPDEAEVSEEPRPPWDDRAWERVDRGPEVPAPVDVVATGAQGLVVAGQGLARIDRVGGGLAPLEALGFRGGSPRSLAVDGAWIFVSTPRAGVLVSEDGGESFRAANGWHALVGPSETEAALELVFAGGDLWGRTAPGALLWSADRGATWTRVLPERRFEAITADGVTGEVVAVARSGEGTVAARGAGGRLVLSTAGPLPAGKILSLAAHDGELAAALSLGAFRLKDGAWSRLDGTAGMTAMTYAMGDGTLVIALHAEGEGRSWVLEARPGAAPLTVAEVGDGGASASDDSDDVRVRALCWDPWAGMVWAAGGFGLIALRPARR